MQAKSAVMIFVGGLGLAVTACDDGMDLDAEGLQGRRNLSTTMGHSTGLIKEQFPVWRGVWRED